MKKTIVSVAATTMIASAFTSQAFASTYQVKSGDSLWGIANKYDTTINQLKEWNKLKNDTIFPKQVLIVTKEASKVSASSVTVTPVKTTTGTTTYKVKSGDSLSAIAHKYNTTVSKLKELNSLKSDIIFPGQVLSITKEAAKSSASSVKVTSVKTTATSTPSTSAKTYKVKAGDTLSGIASKNKVKLADLLTWNNLKATSIIHPGDIIQVSKGTVAASSKSTSSTTTSKNVTSTPKTTDTTKDTPKTTPSKPDDSSKANYTVKAGDTLSALSLQFGISIADLKKLNGLSSDAIYVGQKLSVGAGAQQSPTPPPSNVTSGTTVGNTNGFSASNLINIATKLLGTPYAWAGSSLSGFDCSGFIYYVYNQAGVPLGRLASTGYYARSFYVNSPQPGDLVFFTDTYQAGISHLGIYLGNNQFIHAGDNGVEISSLNETYWKNHFDGFKRLYETI